MSKSDVPPFQNPDRLRMIFADGLRQMLEHHQTMGVFILVLANALADETLRDSLWSPLRQRFDELSEECRFSLRQAQPLDEAEDDVLVFLKLMAMGLDALELPRWRMADPWQLQFNPLRALRPPRASGERLGQLQRPFNEQGFHFNKAFLDKEILWQGRFAGRDLRLLYNKFPFMPLHGLWVPEPQACRPQFLDADNHAYLIQASERLVLDLPGLGLAYNCLGAGASVNHLHFQLFLSSQPLPVELPQWRHNGGDKAYPLKCRRFTDGEAAWCAIEVLHETLRPYNLLYRQGQCYLLERAFQGDFEQRDWLSALAWCEASGHFVFFNHADFQGLDAAQIEARLAAC